MKTNEPSALLPPYGELPPMFWEQHGMAITLAGLASLVVVALLVWLRLKSRPGVVLPPGIPAREALTRLSRQPEDGKTLSEVSQILRHYLIAVFQLPPGELTTAEFNAALARNDQITVEFGESVSRFLHECDQRKFSSTQPSTPFHAVEQALNLISLAEKLRPPAALIK